MIQGTYANGQTWNDLFYKKAYEVLDQIRRLGSLNGSHIDTLKEGLRKWMRPAKGVRPLPHVPTIFDGS